MQHTWLIVSFLPLAVAVLAAEPAYPRGVAQWWELRKASPTSA